jgi:hypothetical protein
MGIDEQSLFGRRRREASVFEERRAERMVERIREFSHRGRMGV